MFLPPFCASSLGDASSQESWALHICRFPSCALGAAPGGPPPPQYQVSGLVELTDSILRVFYAGIQIPFYPAHGHTIHIANTWISSSRERSGLVCFEVYRGADCFQYWEKVTKIRY